MLLTGLVRAFELYLLIGFLFACFFVIKGVGRVDKNAEEGTWGFRLLILPGVAALWPLMLKRMRAGTGRPPEPDSQHHRLARMVYGDPEDRP